MAGLAAFVPTLPPTFLSAVLLAACSGPGARPQPRQPEPSQQQPDVPPYVERLLAELTDATTKEQIVARLDPFASGLLQPRTPYHVGFDEPTLADTIERVAAALPAYRQAPGDPLLLQELARATADYHAALRNELARRIPFGRAGCLPEIR